MAHKYVYLLEYPDGQEYPCNFSELMERLERDFGAAPTKLFRNLVGKRLAGYKDHRVPAVEVAKPPLTTKEAGARRWERAGVPCDNNYGGVEGFAGRVNAIQVWQTLVIDAGRRHPARETIRKRLKSGLRRKAELLMDRPPGRPKGWRGRKPVKPKPAPAKKQALSNAAVAEISNRAKQVPAAPGGGNELPPMRDWVPDTRVYRRQPLR